MFAQSFRRHQVRVFALTWMLLLAHGKFATAQELAPSGCRQPLAEPITIVDTGGGANPVMSKDGCWLFVMANRPPADGGTGVLVFRRTGSTFVKRRTVTTPFSSPVSSLVLTNDQKLLIVAAANSLTFVDVEKATSADADAVVGRVASVGGAFRMAVTSDDRLLFVPQFGPGRVAVFDLDRARRSGFSSESLVPAVVPTGQNPITAVAAPDGRHVYTTNLVAPDVLAGSLTCIDGKQREGGLQVIDVQKAKSDASTATVGWAFPAGCGPNAMALSPDGTRLSNTAANNIFDPNATGNVVVMFDTRPLREGKLPTRIGSVPVPKGPIALVDTGTRILVGFQPEGQTQADLIVIDPSKAASGPGAVIGTISHAAGNLTLAPDGHTVIAAGSLKGGIALIDLDRVVVRPIAR